MEFLKPVQLEKSRACLIPYIFNSIFGTLQLSYLTKWLKHKYIFFDATE